MWIQSGSLTEIDATVRRGRTAEVDRLLSDVFFEPPARVAIPVSCPACHRDLVRQPLAVAGLFVSACPDGHGAWLDPDVAEALRRLVSERAAAAGRRRIVVLSVLAVGSAALAAMLGGRPGPSAAPSAPIVASAPLAASAQRDTVDDTQLSETNWPERRWPGALAIPVKESAINVHAELRYFHQVLALMDAGITNRLNMEGVLKVRRLPQRYVQLYEVYRRRQSTVLERMRNLSAPERLRPIHERLVVATERQISFYGDYARAKADDPTTDLGRLLALPALQEQNVALLDAWSRVRQAYPDLDRQTHDAIYHRLHGFDVI
jgi:hypothetical protein